MKVARFYIPVFKSNQNKLFEKKKKIMGKKSNIIILTDGV